MDASSRAFRASVVDHARLVASAEAQLEYEATVPIANVPAELICGFVDDLFHPKSELMLGAFTDGELKLLAELYGRLRVASDAFAREDAHTVRDILEVPEWRSAMTFAQRLVVELAGRRP